MIDRLAANIDKYLQGSAPAPYALATGFVQNYSIVWLGAENRLVYRSGSINTINTQMGYMSGTSFYLNSFSLDPRWLKSAFDRNILRLDVRSSCAVERDISHFDYLVFQCIHKEGSYPS